MSRYLRTIAVVLAVLSSAICKPIGGLFHSAEELAYRQTPGVARRGNYHAISTPGGGVYPRLEIRDLKKDTDAWNIFILGMRQWQEEVDPNDAFSWYKIMGIHGMQQQWDSVPQADGGPYCALIEQTLLVNARTAVSKFPDGGLKDRYSKVLETLRAPYFDWARKLAPGDPILPDFFQRPKVDIVTSTGNQTIDNPLFSYKFPSNSRKDLYDPNQLWWSEYPNTVRIPTSQDASAASRNDVVESELNKTSLNLRERVHHILTLETNFSNVSSSSYDGDSLESVHDIVHMTIGGDGGHMSNVPYSSFDPIFMFHHLNIDHVAAMWQKGHQDTWVQPQSQEYTTFARPNDAVADENSALYPFHKTIAGDFFSSKDVRDYTVFGYTYDDISDDPAILLQTIEEHYGDPVPSNQKREASKVPKNGTDADQVYIAQIKAPKFALPGGYFVYVFVGEAPGDDSDPSCWNSHPNFAGSTAIWSSDNMKHTTNGTGMVNTVVPLTWTLQKHKADGKVADLCEKDLVTEYLLKNLSWRVLSVQKHDVPLGAIPGIELSVITASVTLGDATKFPVAGEYEIVFTQKVAGKDGGYC
ncbi:Di-copper centre-containing protein [Mytilinidion resinicola]|uniref:tyrosinase n=1 Tax=Mytilinidion resinicola TaxID=574789 RepID=A0A6A6YIL2_9PEZI|nr:Di-copper centre-containing protein [Mytilinidion resinicola]KAF2807767.1 Di-copper centre-containing protein [Mytilinidion resinicola]